MKKSISYTGILVTGIILFACTACKQKADQSGTEDNKEQGGAFGVGSAFGECVSGLQSDGILAGQFLSIPPTSNLSERNLAENWLTNQPL